MCLSKAQENMKQELVVERRLNRRVPPPWIAQQLQRSCDRAMKGGRGTGWRYSLPRKLPAPKLANGHWVYRIEIVFETTTNRSSVAEKWQKIVKRFAEASSAGNLGAAPWRVIQPEGFSGLPEEAANGRKTMRQTKQLAEQTKVLGEIHLEEEFAFDRIFGREPHLRRILDAIRLANDTDWGKRMHTLLYGPPGSGKSEIMQALAATLGKENEAYKWFNAPTMTRAGAVEVVMQSPTIPPVLFIEEIEKVEEHALRWLLGVMDTRGIIRRTNYRVGHEARNVRMVVIATANDQDVLRGLLSGVLYSRFQNRIYCAPPDREIMRKILEREVREINGKMEWIEPALRFAYDELQLRDPREIITVLCGRDRLLDNSLQSDWRQTMEPVAGDQAVNGANGHQ